MNMLRAAPARNGPQWAGGRMALQIYLLVALGSALGGVARYLGSGLVASAFGETFPWGTLLVNVTGSFAIGFFATLTAPDGRLFVSAAGRQFVMAGLCGGFTTFSSFSLQTLNLMRDGEWLYAGGNMAGSVTLCVFSAWLGHVAATGVNQLKGA
jgi:CrcB protein